MPRKIVVLDFSSAEVHVFDVETSSVEDFDIIEFYNRVNQEFCLNLKDSECSWMLTNEVEPLEIIYH